MTTFYPTKEFMDGMRKPQLLMLSAVDGYLKGENDLKFQIYVFPRRSGKTACVIQVGVKVALEYPNKQIIVAMPSYTQGKSVYWDTPRNIVYWLPREVDSNGKSIHIKNIRTKDMVIEFNNGSMIKFISAEKIDNTRGIEGDIVIFDEYAVFENERMFQEMVLPIINATRDKMAIFIFTPMGRNHAYQLWNNAEGKDNWLRYKMNAYQAGIDSREKILKDKGTYTSEAMWRQEVMCEFLADDDMVLINQDIIIGSQSQREWMTRPRENKIVCVVDPSEGGDEAVIYIMLDYNIIDQHIFTSSGKNLQPETIAYKVVEFNNKYHFNRAFVDAIGTGQGVVSALRLMGIPVYEYKANTMKGLHCSECHNLRAETYWSAMELFNDKIIPTPKDQKLIDQLTYSKYSVSSQSGKVTIEKKDLIKKKLGSSTDRADAFLIGCWATRYYVKAQSYCKDDMITKIRQQIAMRKRKNKVGMVA